MTRWTGARDARLSTLYETEPVGGPPQGDFVNAALLLQTDIPPRTLLMLALAAEQKHGRVRLERFGPRTLDIDILWMSGEIVDELGLQVPHPRLAERAFALCPMLELVPDAIDPHTKRPYQETLAEISLSGLRVFETRPMAVQTSRTETVAFAIG